MKKILQSIEDDSPTSTSAEVWLGDPHINGAIFIANQLLKDPHNEIVLKHFKNLLIYFK